MTPFKAQHMTRTTTIHLSAAPDQVFPLFDPLGEKLWVPDWDPVMIYPPTGSPETNAVFTTQEHDGPPAVWIVVQFDPDQHQVTYVRVAPHSHVATIAVQCTGEGAEMTAAKVAYTFTGLTAHGNAYIDTFSEGYYHAWIQQWEAAINHYLSSPLSADTQLTDRPHPTSHTTRSG
jgi:hypothetical protein